jgi:uncharacterized protein with von Willebrand factor type A (vWA) domain
LRESVNSNPQIAKLYAENNDLKAQLNSMKSELKETPESLSYLVSQYGTYFEEISNYIKEYIDSQEKREGAIACFKGEFINLAEENIQPNKYKDLEKQFQESNEVHEKKIEEIKIHMESLVKNIASKSMNN